jgi:hypothetical protein
MQPPRRRRPTREPAAEPVMVRCVVVGKARIRGVSTGDVVELERSHAERLMAGGHVKAAPEPEPDPPPDEKKSRKPRQSAGPSYAQDPATTAERESE